jgi:hypothetical protein
MKKVSWLIVAIAVLFSVIARLPDIRKRLSDNKNQVPKTVVTPTAVDPTLHIDQVPPPLNDTAGIPEDVVKEIASAATPGNDTSPRHMEAAVLMMNAEHDRVWGDGEPGILLLDGLGLHFTRTDNSHKIIEVLLADIASVDKCGIKDRKGHPYHFKIQNADPKQGERIFHDWLEQARLSSQ